MQVFDSLPFFKLYWNFIGLSISNLKGFFVDLVPFSVVELLVWLGLGGILIYILLIITQGNSWLRRHSSLKKILLTGPFLLILMGLGQGAFPLCLAPTAWRLPLSEYHKIDSLPYEEFQDQFLLHQNHLFENFSEEYYSSLSEKEILVGCNEALDSVLEKMQLTSGRTVKRIKAMGPITTLLGLSYGGPAFHDPFLGELAIVKPEDEPAPHYWRLMAVCHETAHAKGFTREMDAEILTQMALSTSKDIRYQMLGDIMFLRKSGEKIHLPEYLRQEIFATRDSLKKVGEQQPVVNFLRHLGEKLNFQNSGGKYGSRRASDQWNPRHPFYATISTWQKKYARQE